MKAIFFSFEKYPLVKYDINPSDSFLGVTTEIHCGGSTIITSGTRSISWGNS